MELLDRLKVRPQVRTAMQWCLGFWPDDEVAKLYQAADVNLFATCAEGFGLPIIEAGACGVPSIVTDWGPAAEVVGEGGIKVPVAVKPWRMEPMRWMVYPDPGGLFRAMVRLHDDAALRAELGQKALENAREYDSEKITQWWSWYLQGRPKAELKAA